MADQYTGDCIVGLMNTIDRSLRNTQSNHDFTGPMVKPGGIVVDVGGLKVCVAPETIESLRRIEARKRQENANGEPFTMGYPPSTIMKAVLKEIGLPDLFD